MLMDAPEINHLTGTIIGAAVEVHRVLGPGLLESIYGTCLQFELAQRKLRFVIQRAVPVTYKSVPLDAKYRVDLIVGDLVVVEIKAVEGLTGVHKAQVLTYLKLTGCPAGLLINFNVARLVDGVSRLINPFPTSRDSGGDGDNGLTRRNGATETERSKRFRSQTAQDLRRKSDN
jgi:GxxExxY protein